MQNSKNFIIAALVALLLISALWGQNEAGKRKQLLRDKETLQTQIKENDTAVKVSGELRAELERQKDALKQAQNRLSNAQDKIDELQEQKESCAEKITAQGEAVQAVEEQKQSLTAEAAQKLQEMQKHIKELQSQCSEKTADLQKQCSEKTAGLQKQYAEKKADLEQQIAQQQTALEEQEQKLTSAAQIIENEQKQLKACKGEVADLEQTEAALKDAEAANQQLEEERDKVLADADTLRAQVIGLEKMVEERSAALKQTSKELDNCKINNDVLISQISQKDCREKNKMKQKMSLPMPEQKASQEPVQKQ